MDRFRKNLEDIGNDGVSFPALDPDLFYSHADRHYEDPSSSDRYGVSQVASKSGSTRFEVGRLNGESYLEIRAPGADDMDAYGQSIFADKIYPQMLRNIDIIRAADTYTAIASEVSDRSSDSLEEIVESELEETKGKEGREILERPETFLEQNFAYFLQGEESQNIDEEYEDVGIHFHKYKDRVLKILDDKGADVGNLWLEHAAS